MKYRPDFPDRFGCLVDARGWAQEFFQWYNHEHYHSRLGLMTPALVHYGVADEAQVRRQQVLQAAYASNPERFVRGMPSPPELPQVVWINEPKNEHSDTAVLL